MSTRLENFLVFAVLLSALPAAAQTSLPSQPSSSSKRAKSTSARLEADINAGNVVNGVYRNRALGMTCKIPAGWVLRTEEMNEREEEEDQAGSGGVSAQPSEQKSSSPQRAQRRTEGKVLLAAFSRPPRTRGEEVNGSILIAAEPVETYPGLKEAVQYLSVLKEVAEQQGFKETDDPYEIAIGTKTLVREDFHKDVGTHAMRQATLAMLAKGYAVSITVIGGTEDEVEELLDGVEFGVAK